MSEELKRLTKQEQEQLNSLFLLTLQKQSESYLLNLGFNKLRDDILLSKGCDITKKYNIGADGELILIEEPPKTEEKKKK